MKKKSFIELQQHNSIQYILFVLLTLGVSLVSMVFLIRLSDIVFQFVFSGATFTTNASSSVFYPEWQIQLPIINPADIEEPPSLKVYFVEPVLIYLPFVLVVGFIGASLITMILPMNIGLLRQKIHRVIVNTLDTISIEKIGVHDDSTENEIAEEIMESDYRSLNDLARKYGRTFDDMLLLHNVLIWYQATFFSRIFRSFQALRFYLKEHFSVKYSSTMLGLIYMGAAILIIVIGLRGLQFIPAIRPTIILSSLLLEFVLLFFYAIFLMFSKSEEDPAKNPDETIVELETSESLKRQKEIEVLYKAFSAKKK